MKKIFHILPIVALLTGMAGCDRNRNDREHANGTSPPQTVPTKTGEAPAAAAPPPP